MDQNRHDPPDGEAARSQNMTFSDRLSVLFHELTHATGHASRLDRATLRDLLAFGDTNYSREELCVRRVGVMEGG